MMKHRRGSAIGQWVIALTGMREIGRMKTRGQGFAVVARKGAPLVEAMLVAVIGLLMAIAFIVNVLEPKAKDQHTWVGTMLDKAKTKATGLVTP